MLGEPAGGAALGLPAQAVCRCRVRLPVPVPRSVCQLPVTGAFARFGYSDGRYSFLL